MNELCSLSCCSSSGTKKNRNGNRDQTAELTMNLIVANLIVFDSLLSSNHIFLGRNEQN